MVDKNCWGKGEIMMKKISEQERDTDGKICRSKGKGWLLKGKNFGAREREMGADGNKCESIMGEG